MLKHIHHDHRRIRAKAIKGAEGGQGGGNIAAQDLFKQGNGLGPISQAEHVANNIKSNHLAAVGLDNGLIEQGQTIADRAFSRPGNQGQAIGIDQGALGLTNLI